MQAGELRKIPGPRTTLDGSLDPPSYPTKGLPLNQLTPYKFFFGEANTLILQKGYCFGKMSSQCMTRVQNKSQSSKRANSSNCKQPSNSNVPLHNCCEYIFFFQCYTDHICINFYASVKVLIWKM